MPTLIGNRDDRLQTLQGHTFVIKKDEPFYVPPVKPVIGELLKRGHQLVPETSPKRVASASKVAGPVERPTDPAPEKS
jgi:hypothetical protein